MAACMKLGSKSEGFMRRGQAWFCTTGLPSDVTVVVEEMSFHLHKFPLISKSGLLARLIAEAGTTTTPRSKQNPQSSSDETHQEIEESPDDDDDDEELDKPCTVRLPGIPGGTEAFELAAKFCYGVKLELTAANIVPLRCAAEYLEMGEDLGEGNLILKAEGFLNQVVLRSWKDSVRALQSCDRVLDRAQELGIVKRCIDSISAKACTDPALFGWPLLDHHLTLQSPGGSVLWNGISTGARPRNARRDWWYDDVSNLSLPMFQRLILAMEARGLKPEIISGAVISYAKKYLPGLNRRRGGGGGGSGGGDAGVLLPLGDRRQVTNLGETEQRVVVEAVERLVPAVKGAVPVKFLFGLLRLGMILGASNECKARLEARIGMQLEEASLDDLLMPNYSYAVETLYDVDVVERIVEHFLTSGEGQGSDLHHQHQQIDGSSSPVPGAGGSTGGGATPLMQVAKLMDAYLAEIAPDVNLKMSKFQQLAELLPEFSRLVDDGLYRAIDIYLKAHHWLSELEREKLCRTMDCQKLSLEACTHAAQNERLPLRVVVQVLFFEQLQLRTAIAGCFLVSESVDNAPRSSRPNPVPSVVSELPIPAAAGAPGRNEGWANVLRENQVMKSDMDKMRSRVFDLEKECTKMRMEIEKLGKGKGSSSSAPSSSFSLARKLGCKTKPQVVKPQESGGGGSVLTTLAAALERPEKPPKPQLYQQQQQQQLQQQIEEGGLKKPPVVRRHHRRTHSLA